MIISSSGPENPQAPIDKKHPASVRIKSRSPLTQGGSTKQTVHVTLDLKGSGVSFKAGDSLGVYPQNDPILVSHLVKAMKATGKEMITDPRSGVEISLWDFLTYKANLSRVTSSFLKLFYEYESEHDKKNQLHRLLQQENKPLLVQYLANHDPLDLFREYADVQTPLQELCAQFGPLLPRFYSVASSPKQNPDEVDLTVALFTFTHSGEQRYGVASHFLCHLAKVGETPIPVYVQTAPHFNLPDDDTIPVIMVGPGTGIAPFRAFLQERVARQASGKNWLFFGERNAKSDYFYQDFLEDLVAKGKLKLDLAFSRDQAEKIYVQHRMLAESKALWAWLQEGAYFYVCGDAHRMAKDVEAALVQIAEQQGGLEAEAAKSYIRGLRKQGRYLADVY